VIKFRNGWFHSTDLGNVAKIIRTTALADPTRWLKHGIDCKYVEIRVDMRTGDFCLKNAFNELMSDADILAMFPDLGEIELFDHES
jgi:hypothetical protein